MAASSPTGSFAKIPLVLLGSSLLGLVAYQAWEIRRQRAIIAGLEAKTAPAPAPAPAPRAEPVAAAPPKAEGAPARPAKGEAPATNVPAAAQLRLDPAALNIMEADGELSEMFSLVMGLAPEERTKVAVLLKAAKIRLAELATANATASEGPTGELTIKVRQFPEGEALFDGLLRDLRAALGPARGKTFSDVFKGDAVARSFGNFGTSVRTIHVSRTGEGFSLSDSFRVPNGAAMTRGMRFTDPAALSEDYRGLVNAFAEQVNSLPARTRTKK